MITLIFIYLCIGISIGCNIRCLRCDSELAIPYKLLSKEKLKNNNCWDISQAINKELCLTVCETHISITYAVPEKWSSAPISKHMFIRRKCSAQADEAKPNCNWKRIRNIYTTNCTFQCTGYACNDENVHDDIISSNIYRYIPTCRTCIIEQLTNQTTYSNCKPYDANEFKICFGYCYTVKYITPDKQMYRYSKGCIGDFNNYKVHNLTGTIDLHGIWIYGLCKASIYKPCNMDMSKFALANSKSARPKQRNRRRSICLHCSTNMESEDADDTDCQKGLASTMFNVEPCSTQCLTYFSVKGSRRTLVRGCDDTRTRRKQTFAFPGRLPETSRVLKECTGCFEMYQKIEDLKYSSKWFISFKGNDLNDCKLKCNLMENDCSAFIFVRSIRECHFTFLAKGRDLTSGSLVKNSVSYSKTLTRMNCKFYCFTSCMPGDLMCNNAKLKYLKVQWLNTIDSNTNLLYTRENNGSIYEKNVKFHKLIMDEINMKTKDMITQYMKKTNRSNHDTTKRNKALEDISVMGDNKLSSFGLPPRKSQDEIIKQNGYKKPNAIAMRCVVECKSIDSIDEAPEKEYFSKRSAYRKKALERNNFMVPDKRIRVKKLVNDKDKAAVSISSRESQRKYASENLLTVAEFSDSLTSSSGRESISYRRVKPKSFRAKYGYFIASLTAVTAYAIIEGVKWYKHKNKYLECDNCTDYQRINKGIKKNTNLTREHQLREVQEDEHVFVVEVKTPHTDISTDKKGQLGKDKRFNKFRPGFVATAATTPPATTEDDDDLDDELETEILEHEAKDNNYSIVIKDPNSGNSVTSKEKFAQKPKIKDSWISWTTLLYAYVLLVLIYIATHKNTLAAGIYYVPENWASGRSSRSKSHKQSNIIGNSATDYLGKQRNASMYVSPSFGYDASISSEVDEEEGGGPVGGGGRGGKERGGGMVMIATQPSPTALQPVVVTPRSEPLELGTIQPEGNAGIASNTEHREEANNTTEKTDEKTKTKTKQKKKKKKGKSRPKKSSHKREESTIALKTDHSGRDSLFDLLKE